MKLEATPLHVDYNRSSSLKWTSTGAKWCYSRGVWGSPRSLQGTFNTGPLTKNTWYAIVCSDGNTEVSDWVTVVVRDPPGSLTVDLTATPQQVDPGGSATLKWTSTGAKWCYSRGAWGSERGLQGSYDTQRLWSRTWFGIVCSDGNTEVSDGVAVTVRSAPAPLSVDITATPQQVNAGGTSALKWTSTGAKWCYSRGVWGSSRPLQGTFQTGRLWKNTWFGIVCSDGTKEVSDGVTVSVSNAPATLSVDLTATPQQVDPGGTSTLKWTSTGAKWCYSRGVWGSARPLQGTFQTGRLWKNTWFGITCSDGSKEVSDGVTVNVSGGSSQVSVKLDANPRQIAKGKSSTLTWSSTGATACTASGGWSGSKALSGTFVTGALSNSTTYGLTCQNGQQNALASVTVQVNAVPVVRWQAPTQNVDGTPLTDLAGFRLYWGKSTRSYTGSAKIDSPTGTQYQPSHLASGTYFMAVTAVDSQGNESAYSNEVQIVIP